MTARGAELQSSQESYASAFRVGIMMFALLFAVLCVVLDSTIVSKAFPRIKDDFHGLHDVDWYGSGQPHHPHYETIYDMSRLIALQLICPLSLPSS